VHNMSVGLILDSLVVRSYRYLPRARKTVAISAGVSRSGTILMCSIPAVVIYRSLSVRIGCETDQTGHYSQDIRHILVIGIWYLKRAFKCINSTARKCV